MGIDPGLKGAIAYIDPQRPGWVEAHDMPTVVVTRNGLQKREIDRPRLAALIGLRAHQTQRAIVEKVGAGSGQGTTSMFAFGKAAGIALMAPECFSIPVEESPPSVWKRYMGVTSEKASSLAKAKQIFPEHADLFARVKDDGRAEAALLAVYAHRHLN